MRLLKRRSNQTAILSVEKSVFSTSEESYASQIEREDYAGIVV
jgi:hypothetical protein